MTTTGDLLPCKNKSQLIHALEGLVEEPEDQRAASPLQESDTHAQDSSNQVDASAESPLRQSSSPFQKHLIIDAMAVVQAIVSATSNTFSTFKDIARAFVYSTNSLLYNYTAGRVICGSYNKKLKLKDDIRTPLL